MVHSVSGGISLPREGQKTKDSGSLPQDSWDEYSPSWSRGSAA
jgi:hypothetical protein